MNDKPVATSVAVTLEPEDNTPSFLAESLELRALFRQLDKVSKAAVNVLVKVMEDEKSSQDAKMKAAIKLLEFHQDVAKAISQDQLQRMIAEFRLRRAPTQKLVPLKGGEEDAPPQRPLVDFSTIRSVE